MLLNNIYGGHVPGIAALITALALLLAGGADAATDIDTCRDIIQEGEYRLSQDLTNDSTCISIQSGNVTLDGAGFTISGTERPGNYGMVVFNSTMILTNITVKNLTTKYWESGIIFNNVVHGNITNTTASSNLLYGIYFVSSGGNTLTDNIANSNGDYGIYFHSSSNGALNNNIANLNKMHGIYLYSSDNNTLINNNASSNNNTGFYLRYSNNNTLVNSTASSNGENGIYLEYSGVNTLTNNTASLNIQKGFKLSFSNYNILIDNTISSSSDGIIVDDPSNGNRIIGNWVYNTTDQGIVLIRAFNNIVRENNVSFNSGEGILVLESSWNNTISNNIADSNGQCGGICLLNSGGSIITNNTVDSNTIGITLNSSAGNILNNNTINSNNYGVYVAGGAASYNIPEVSFSFIDVNVSSASPALGGGTINEYDNYTTQYDDDSFLYKLPFTFPFIGRNITKISVNTNGLIELLENNEDCAGCGESGTHYKGNHAGQMDAIFASNDDLLTGISGDTYLSSEYTYLGVFNLTNSVVVEWYGLTFADKDIFSYDPQSNIVNFQVVLYPNGTIEWNFKTMNFSRYGYDMFTGVYAKEEDAEIAGGYIINTRKSLAINLSTALPVPAYNTIRNNRISNNNPGIYLNSSNNTIYNNYFNNSNNAIITGGNNTWNITRTIGSNIIDGPYLGGNFWAQPDGAGFSQACADANADGICDSSYMPGSDNTDYLALAPFLRKTSTSITVNTDVNANQTIEISPDESRNITNSTIELNATISASVILKINASTDASALNATSATPVYGLDRNEQLIGRYIEVNVTGIDAVSLNFVNLTMYYTAADLDMNGDGDADDPGDLNEQTLKMYWYNSNATGDSERWKPLGPGIEPNPDYTSIGGPKVLGGERNTTADYLKVTLNHFSTFALAAEIASTGTSPSSAGNSGSNSGGGGVITLEPPGNIAAAEKHEKSIIAGTPVAYTFTTPELGIYEVDVTGKESENDVSLRVEVLKGTSKLVSVSPPGTVYKNLNVWMGSKRIKEAAIKFRVGNSWLNSSDLAAGDVRMLKWDGSKWAQLDTTRISGDASYVYYEATADALSHFAISGLGGTSVPMAPGASQMTPATTPILEVTGMHPEEAPPVRLVLIIGVFALIAIIAFLYFRKNRY